MKAKRMKKKEKKNKIKFGKILKIVVILLLFTIIGVSGYFIFQNYNNSKEENLLLADKDVFGMKLRNIKIEQEGEIYIFRAEVKNTLNEKFEKQPVQIVFKDEGSQKILKYQYVILNLEKGETQEIEIKTSEPLDEFYTFEIKKVK